MAALTVVHVAPAGQALRNLRAPYAMLMALLLPLASVQAQVTPCPVGIEAGNNQVAIAGTRFQIPLQIGQNGATSPIPDPVPVQWTVVPSGASPLYFLENLSSTYADNLFWVTNPSSSFSGAVNLVAPADALGTYQVTAQTSACSTGIDTTNFSVTVVAPSAPMLDLYQGSGQSATTGGAFATPLGIFVSEGGSTPVTNAKVTFTVGNGQPAHFLENGQQQYSGFTDGTGHLTVNLVADPGVTIPTGITVTTDSLGQASVYSGLTVTPLGGAYTISESPSSAGIYSASVGSPFSTSFAIHAEDTNSAPVSSVTVTYTLSGSTGAVLTDNTNTTVFGNGEIVETNAVGDASINVRAGALGTFTLTAATDTGGSVVWNLEAISGGSDVYELHIVSGDGQSAIRGQTFGQTLDVEALINGTPTNQVPLTFAVAGGSAQFRIGNGTSQTVTIDTMGQSPIASAELIAGNQDGPVVINVTGPGSFTPVTFNMLVAPAEPEEVFRISGDNQQGAPGTTLAQPLIAGASYDAFINHAGAQLLFEVISGDATFQQSETATYSVVPTGSELSAPANLRLGSEVGPVQVRVSFPGMLPTVFSATAVNGGSGSGLQLIKIAGDGQNATTSIESDPLRIRLTDSGSPVVNGDVDWQIVSGDAVLLQTHTKTDDNGESQTTLQIGPQAGNIIVQARSADGPNGSTVTATFSLSSADAHLQAVSGSGQGGATGSNADQVFVFELRRANGSLLPGIPVSFAASLGATVTPATAITGMDGRVSTGVRYGSDAGTLQVTATAFDGRVSAASQAGTFVPTMAIGSGNNQNVPANTMLHDPLVVVISQPAGAGAAPKGLQGVIVTWSIVSGGGALGSATSVTDSNGRASNTLRLGSSLGVQQVRAAIVDVGEVVFTAYAAAPDSTLIEIVSGNDQEVIPQQPSAPLVVRVRTAAGSGFNGLPGITIRFTPSSGVSVNPVEVVTGADGRASTLATVTLPGDFTITASVPSLTSVTPVVFRLGNGLANIPQLQGPENAVARAIDSACPALAAMSNLSQEQQDLLVRCSELVVNANNSTDEVVDALGEMLADESSAQNNAALASASAQFENLKGRLAALRSGSQGANFGGLAIATASGRLPLSFLPSNLLLNAAEDGTSADPSNAVARWGFFATGTIGRGSRDPGNVDPGGDFDNYGITAGIDYRVTESLVLGAALGFNRNDSQLNQDLGDLDSRGYSFSGYGTWFKGNNYYADAVLTVGRNSTDTRRHINYTLPSLTGGTTTIDQIASGTPDSDQQSFALSVGKDFNRGAWSFGPYLRGTYTRLDFDGYLERMSDPNGPGAGLALTVEGRELTSMQAVLGGKLSYAMSTSWGVLMPHMQIEYVKELEDDADGLVTRFAFDPTNADIVINGDQLDTDFLNIGIGLSGVFANGRSGYVYYEHVAGKERISQGSLAIGVRIEF